MVANSASLKTMTLAQHAFEMHRIHKMYCTDFTLLYFVNRYRHILTVELKMFDIFAWAVMTKIILRTLLKPDFEWTIY